MNNIKKIEKIFCEVMELKTIPKNFAEMKIGSINQWDSLANMNLLMSLEKNFSIRLSLDEMTEINSIDRIKLKFLKLKKEL
jgi:acyl carrier protein